MRNYSQPKLTQMKKYFLFAVASLVFATSFSASSISVPATQAQASEIFLPMGPEGQKVSLLSLSKMKVKEYQQVTGQRLNLYEKVTFKFAQKKLRKSINSDGTINAKSFEKFDMKAGGEKSQLIALILVALVGGLGIHRFYLGYTWQGIVQLLTLGGCGIWSLIDLIRIITGSLQPKDGSYDKTL